MRQRRLAPAWLVDPSALVAVAESRRSAQAVALQAMAGLASAAIEQRLSDSKTAPQPRETMSRS
jgi:hypothetical protein